MLQKYLPIKERVHVTGVSMGFLERCRYLYCHMAVYDLSDRQPRLSSMFEILS